MSETEPRFVKLYDFFDGNLLGQRRNSVAELSEDDRQTVHEEWQIRHPM